MPTEPTSLDHPDDAPKEFELGILLVHGIGMQPPLETLVRWTDKLIQVINKANLDNANPDSLVASIGRAGPSHNSGDRFAEAELDLRRSQGGEPERWLVTEGWWEDAFPAPTFRELFSWSLRGLPWFIACYLARFGLLFPDKADAEVSGSRYWNFRALTHRVTAYLLMPVVMLILGVLLVLGALPIPQVRSFVMAAQSRLTATVGDSFAFVESPVRAALIRSRILDTLECLKARCDNTIVIAHSQGAAVCVDALGGNATAKAGEQRAEGPVPDTLLTFGAGTNPLLSIKGYAKRFAYIVWIEVLTFYVFFGLLGFLVRAVWLQEVSIGDVATAVGITLASFFAVMLVIVLVLFGTMIWAKLKLKKDSKDFTEMFMSLGAKPFFLGVGAMFLGAVAVAFYIAAHSDRPVLPVFLVAAAIVAFLATLSDKIALFQIRHVKAQIPPRLKRWIDLYASSDPVPNGQTRVVVGDAEDKLVESETEAQEQDLSFDPIEIYNEGSILTDHTTYWENCDGFVLRVLHACADTAGSPWRERLPAATAAGNRRARWRVNHLRLGRLLLNLGALTALALLWGRFHDSPPLPLGLPEWTRALVLVFLVLAAWVVASHFLRLPWRRWVRSEQEQVIAGKPVQRTPWRPFVLMGMVLGITLLLVAATGRWDGSQLQRPAIELIGLVLLFIAAGIGLELFARWLLKAPKD